jgi:hypothetical protein
LTVTGQACSELHRLMAQSGSVFIQLRLLRR